MKNNIFTGMIIVFFGFMLAAIFTGCKQKSRQENKVESNVYYTCTMHSQVHKEKPGDCPICGMKLIKVELTGAATGINNNKLTLTATQIQLADIRTAKVQEENTGHEKVLPGTVTTDENKATELNARMAGRIQRLFFRTTGEAITVGQPVYSIYSTELLETEKEYLLAIQQQKQLHNPDIDYRQLTKAAENRLLLWGLTQSQIKKLAVSGEVSATTVIYSNISGTISDLAVHEGDYITEGMTILKAQDLSNLWVQAQLYANETIGFKINDKVNISFPGPGSEIIAGKVDFINPDLTGGSQIDLLRVSIPNRDGKIKPGMQAYIFTGKGAKLNLAAPASAILTDGKSSRVWVKNNDGSFSMRGVTAGEGNADFVQILSGLEVGEVVVTNGAYLLNSEYIFKNGSDNAGMGGMKM